MSQTRGLDNKDFYNNNYQDVREHDGKFSYRFLSLNDIINNFTIAYVGDDKIIPKARRVDISFHATRALQELSYDTLKSILSQEIVVPASLKMVLPHNYVNYVKLTWTDNSGIEHTIYPATKTSHPIKIDQDSDGVYQTHADGSSLKTSRNDPDNTIPTTWTNYKSTTPSENQKDDYNVDSDTFDLNIGQRYGLDPKHSQVNGSFFIDEVEGNIHFSSNISGKTVILKYISDGISNDEDYSLNNINIHKFAEEAMYKQMAYAILSTRINTPPQLIQMYKREAFAAKRNAKLRLSNIKIEEIAQMMRGKSKIIKH